MELLRNISSKIMLLHDPQLVADFQSICKINISSKDSGLSTADDDTDESSESSDGLISSLDDEKQQNDLVTNGGHLINKCKTNSNSLKGHAEYHGKDNLICDYSDSFKMSKQGSMKCSEYSVKYRGQGSLTKVNEQTLRSKIQASISKNVPNYSMENNVAFKINNMFLYYLFSLGTALGNEAFYCYFFPYWFWNVDGFVCRRVVLVWAVTMYIGQMAKDIIRWPRPSSPPVAKLEQRYELEYGMPSTHSMIGFAIPFSLLILTVERYVYSWTMGLIACSLWCGLVSLSRAYLGMHSFLDIVAGLATGMILTPLTFLFLDSIDNFQLTHPYAPVVLISACLLLALCYPTLDKWSTARGDTTLILGVTAGIGVASWLSYQQGLYHRPTESPPYVVKIPDMEFVLTTIVRMTLGGTILMATRTTMKFILIRILCFVYGFQRDDLNIRKCLRFELPFKFITYLVVAFNVAYTAPVVFRCLGVERITFFTDL